MCVDLNILRGDGSSHSLQDLKSQAFRLGWNYIALNHVASGTLSDRDRCRWNASDKVAPAAATTESFLASRRYMHALLRKPGAGLPTDAHSNSDGSGAAAFAVYSRLTLVTDDAAAAGAMSERSTRPDVVHSYDLLAIQPLTERVFQLACSTLAVDIIAIDISRRLPFRVKPAALQAAMKRGVHFEVCYSAALLDTAARRNAFASAQALVNALRGRAIVLASGANAAFQLRGPADAANLASLFGLDSKQAKAAVGDRGAAVLQHAALRRMYKGVISVRDKLPGDAALTLPDAVATDSLGRPAVKHEAHVPKVAVGNSDAAVPLGIYNDSRQDGKRKLA